jgi:glycosyltransferase GT-like protein
MVETALSYPHVCDEWETLRLLQAGRSIARFGDGELKMLGGRSYRRQIGSQRLADELRQVLLDPHPSVAVGIPTMDPRGPKFANWDRHRKRFCQVLKGSKVQYCSAFISRPDSAPWINCLRFAAGMAQLWCGRRVVVLCEPDNSLLKLVQLSALQVTHVACPTYQAYDQIDAFEELLLAATANIAVMSCGPSATCLSNRLARHGLQALDLGSAGGFLFKLSQAAA